MKLSKQILAMWESRIERSISHLLEEINELNSLLKSVRSGKVRVDMDGKPTNL